MQAKVTDDQVREIRRLHDEGVGNRDIAKQLAFGRTTVSKIVTRKIRKYVE
jgi:IS30 family transposase